MVECPKCKSKWIADKHIGMVITKRNIKPKAPAGLRYQCVACKHEWD